MEDEIPILVVRSSTWHYFRNNDVRMSGKVPKEVNSAVIEILKKAIARAKLNKRSTILPQDI